MISPLDVLKIRLQLRTRNRSANPLLPGSGAVGLFRDIIRDEGITALWKGNIPAEALYVSFSAVQFLIYRSTSRVITSSPFEIPTSLSTFICGATAGSVATTFTYPLDLLRTRFAAQGKERVYSSLRSSITEIYTTEGARGFFRGLSTSVVQIVPYMGLFFTGYEAFRIPAAKLGLPFGSSDATAGVAASICAKSAVFPLDTIRKRLQVQGPARSKYVYADIPLYSKGLVHTFRQIVKTEGYRGLYRGLTVGLFKAAPASAVTVWTYERVLSLLKV